MFRFLDNLFQEADILINMKKNLLIYEVIDVETKLFLRTGNNFGRMQEYLELGVKLSKFSSVIFMRVNLSHP